MMLRLGRHSTASSSVSVPAACLPDEAATASAAGAPLSFPAAAPEDRLLTAGEITFHSLWRVLNIYRRFRSPSTSAQQKPPTTQLVGQQHHAQQLVGQQATRQQEREKEEREHRKSDPSDHQEQTSQQEDDVLRERQRRPPEEPDAPQQYVGGRKATEEDANHRTVHASSLSAESPCASLSSREDLEAQFSPRLRWNVSDGSLLLPLFPVSPDVEQHHRTYLQVHEVLMGLPPAILVSKRPSPNALPLDAFFYSPQHSQSHLSFPRGGGKPPLSLRQLFLHVPISRREQAWLDALHVQLARLFRPLPSCSPLGATSLAALGSAADASVALLRRGSTTRATTRRGSSSATGDRMSSATPAAGAARGVRSETEQQQHQQEGTHPEPSSIGSGETGDSGISAGGEGGGAAAVATTGSSSRRNSSAALPDTATREEGVTKKTKQGEGDSARVSQRATLTPSNDKQREATEGTEEATGGADNPNSRNSSRNAETEAAAARRGRASAGTGGEGDPAAAAAGGGEEILRGSGAGGASEGATAAALLAGGERGAGRRTRAGERAFTERSGAASSRTDAHPALPGRVSSESTGFFSGSNMSRESSTESMLLDRDLLLLRGDDDDETVDSLLQARAAEDAHFAAVAAGYGPAGTGALAGEGGGSKRLDTAHSHGGGLLHYRYRHSSSSSKRAETGNPEVLQPYPQLLEPTLLRVLWLMYRSSPRKYPPPTAPPPRREDQVQQTLSGQLLQQQRQIGRRSTSLFSRRREGRPRRRSSSSSSRAFQRSSGSNKDSESCCPVSPLRAESATPTAAAHRDRDAAEAAIADKRADVPDRETRAKEEHALSSGAVALGAGTREDLVSLCSAAAASRRDTASPSAADAAGRGEGASPGAAAERQTDARCSFVSGSAEAVAAAGVIRNLSSQEEQVDDQGRYLDTCMTPEEEIAEAEGLAVEAAAHVMKMVAFRREMFPLSDSSAELGEDLNKGVLYWTGRDVAMRPVLVLNLHRLDAALSELPRFLRLLLFVFEWGLRFMMIPGKVETCVVMFDVREVSLWSLPYKCLQVLVQTLTLQYPFRLRKMFVLHNSRLINGFWNVAKVFLTDVQQSKIAMFKIEKGCSNPELLAQVHALVPPSQLEEKYGGTRENIEEGFYPFPIAPAQPLPRKDTHGQIHEQTADELPMQDCWEAADALTAFGITWEDGCRLPVQWNPRVAATILKHTRARGRAKARMAY